jgi:PDZ domain-containing protein
MQDDGPVSDSYNPYRREDEAAPDVPVLTARGVTQSVALVTTALLMAAAAFLGLPYAVESPGPTIDTLGEYGGTDLIAIAGAPSYDSAGELRLTTVSMRGGEGSPVVFLTMLSGWLDGDSTVLPIEEVYPSDQSQAEINELNAAEMVSSQEKATVAALEELGYEVPTTLKVVEAIEGTGAFGIVEPDDVLVSIDGEELGGYSELSRAMDEVQPGDVVHLGVTRDGVAQDLVITTVDDGTGRALLGVFIDPEFDLPLDVRIRIEDVGGPSAGLMFSLGIINMLTLPDETGGAHIAGTGTLDLDGTVGAIGGIAQKMAGAARADADWFLAPVDDCSEVVGHVPPRLRVVAVGTLAEARAAVEAIGRSDADDLPTCADVLADQG